jgi:site-specific DNA recombinase
MRAAIYARKSTEQHGVADEAKSVARQTEGAQRFCATRGWTVAEVYEDDGVSGALFANRAEFQRMMHDAKTGHFQVLVFYDLDRFGRDSEKTMAALYTLDGLGIAIHDYSTGQIIDLDSFETRLPTILKAEFAQQFREQIRKHTRAAMVRKAERGQATGGRPFGYDNVRIAKGHAELRINEAEAAVVRGIYERAARGEGARTIAAALNRGRVPSPRAQQGRPNGWSQSTVRAVLTRPLYRGEIVYGRTKKAYGRELKKVNRDTQREYGQIPRPEDTWIRVPAPALRIVDAEVAARVDARLQEKRTRYLASLQDGPVRQPEKAHGKYLLSGGMLLCPTCGSHFEAVKAPWKADGVYVCSTRRRKPGVCSNVLTVSMAHADETVLGIVEGEVFGTDHINELLALVDAAPDPTAALRAERDRLQREMNNLVESVAAGVPAGAVAPKIREREQKIANIDAQLRAPRPEPVDVERLRAALEQRTAEWKAILRTEPKVARVLLRRVLGPIEMPAETAEDLQRIVDWEVKTKPEGLLDGIYNRMASPAGFEPAFWP